MSEEFEKWKQEKELELLSTQGLTNSAWEQMAWQAARELDAKRIAELEAQNKAMREALETIVESGLLSGSYKLHTKISDIARQALALDKD